MSTFALHWTVLAMSLTNVSLCLWLGLTVLLNARKRDWGILVTGGALLIAAGFFLYHAAIFSTGIARISAFFFSSWPFAWAIGFSLPFAWYLVMLWYGGYWEQRGAMRYTRLHAAALVTLLSIVALGILLYLLAPLPLSRPYPITVFLAGPNLGPLPLTTLIYAACIILCISMSLLALRFPAPSSLWMDALARRRALPWLSAAALLLLAVSLAVSATLLWVSTAHPPLSRGVLPPGMEMTAFWADLGIIALVLVSVLCLGQAVVSFEIFAGKPLPRGGLRRNWRRAIMLSFGLSLATAFGVAAHMPTIYAVLLAVLVIATFFALHNWRSINEHERFIAHLRPFVSGPLAYDALLDAASPSIDADMQFHTLCDWLLGTRIAYLEAIGPYAALVGHLSFPHTNLTVLSLADLLPRCEQRTLGIPLDPARYAGACWAVPLWGTRGLIGILLLGDKRDGGIFTQEEIEIARAAGERLIETIAAMRLASRLMTVQRDRLSESQVIDRRVRRMLHDDILPRLHAAMLTLSALPRNADALEQLADLHRQISDLLRDMPGANASPLASAGLLAALRRMVCEEYAGGFDSVDWQASASVETAIAALSTTQAEVLFCAAREVVRNASRYARGDDLHRPLHLRVQVGDEHGLTVSIEDNGVGMRPAMDAAQGAGQGILLHSTMMAVINGSWTMETEPGKFTRVTLQVTAS
jgi:signal transduction histidine kinase